ncbi:hypothetical protein [Actinoplanes sp. NPDC026670]|uniref:hypothetical protein n=1 Tax=Actinoplanes sp. NPDC026670 TaxID=3154700 RepID=UPI0033F74433
MSAVGMFVQLVDRSVQRIAEIVADGRRFDRREVARLADVWDNNTSHFFGMLGIRNRWLRERAARAGLRWMGSFHRDWMVEVCGEPMRRLVPVPERPLYYRDSAGQVCASVLPVAVAGLEDDYDLGRATAQLVQIERAGNGFSGSVRVRAARVFADGAGEFHLQMPVSRAVFDSRDAVGLRLSGGEIRIGGAGLLSGGPVTVWFDDREWHLSRAARAVEDQVAPWRQRKPDRAPARRAVGAASAAALEFRESMLHIRRVRFSGHVGQVALEQLVTPLARAGTRAWEASRLRGADREREFESMAGSWGAIADLPRGEDLVPDGACLTFVSCGAGQDGVRVNFAEPAGGRWPVRAARLDRPGGVVVSCEKEVLEIGGRAGSAGGMSGRV